MVADNDSMRDWVADCNGEGREQAVRYSGDSRVVMMAVAVEDGGGRQQWNRQTTTAEDNNAMQDWAADYHGEGQEQGARDDETRVAMRAVEVEYGGGRRRRRQTTTMTTADNNSGRGQKQQTTTARKIGRWTTRGKEETRW
jgi:hypothetical protein